MIFSQAAVELAWPLSSIQKYGLVWYGMLQYSIMLICIEWYSIKFGYYEEYSVSTKAVGMRVINRDLWTDPINTI